MEVIFFFELSKSMYCTDTGYWNKYTKITVHDYWKRHDTIHENRDKIGQQTKRSGTKEYAIMNVPQILV